MQSGKVTVHAPYSLLTAVVAAALALAAFLATMLAPPAHAHSDLVASTPADGQVLETPPASVTLQFNETISPAGLQVVAQGPDGSITLGTPLIEGASVITPWPADAPGGDYRVAYRVVSADGHPIDGSLSFSYTAAEAAPGELAATPTEPADLGQSAIASETTSAPEPESSAFPWWVAVGAVIVGVGIGAAIARAMRARAAKNQ